MSAAVDIAGTTGSSFKLVVWNGATVWNGAAFEAFNAGNVATYKTTIPEIGMGRYRLAGFPPLIPAGEYFVQIWDDVADDTADQYNVSWDGADLVKHQDFNARQKGQINAEVLDVMNVDTYAELTAVPAAITTIRQMLQLVYTIYRNPFTQTNSVRTVRKADGTSIATGAVSDDGTTYTRAVLS